MNRVVYTQTAYKDLRALEKKTAQRIVEKIESYSKKEKPLSFAKPLKEPYGDLFRFRIGSYRAIVSADMKGRITVLTVLKIGHRKDIYS